MNDQSKIVKLPEETYEATIRKYSRDGGYISGDDHKSPWIPFGESAAIKHFCFDVRTNSVANILWVKGGWADRYTQTSWCCLCDYAGRILGIL
jgi:2,4'-dihydroxyacetophenone dioxygenase